MSLMADLNQIAHRIVRESTEPKAVETAAQISGRKGGLKGGKARASKLAPEERTEIARKAATARWGKRIATSSDPPAPSDEPVGLGPSPR